MTLRVIDATRSVALIEQGRVADNFFTRMKGLIGVRHLPQGDGLLISPANSIHTHFMSIPIDVLYVNRKGEVIDLDPDMTPGRLGRLRFKARYVIELPAGTLARHGVAVGDQLEITF